MTTGDTNEPVIWLMSITCATCNAFWLDLDVPHLTGDDRPTIERIFAEHQARHPDHACEFTVKMHIR